MDIKWRIYTNGCITTGTRASLYTSGLNAFLLLKTSETDYVYAKSIKMTIFQISRQIDVWRSIDCSYSLTEHHGYIIERGGICVVFADTTAECPNRDNSIGYHLAVIATWHRTRISARHMACVERMMTAIVNAISADVLSLLCGRNYRR